MSLGEVFWAAVVCIGGLWYLYEWVQDRRTPDPGTTEYVRQLYFDDVIDEQEFERRIDVLEDPEADRIRQAVERVNGVGESTSFAIAARFDTLDDLRYASQAQLRDVPGVGPQRAQDILVGVNGNSDRRVRS